MDRWNTTAFWVYSPDGDAFSPERELQWVRRLGSETELHYTYNETRVSRERQMDLVMKSMTLGDSGVYRCKFRKPPNAWQIWIEYNVIVEGKRWKLILDISTSSKLFFYKKSSKDHLFLVQQHYVTTGNLN